MLTKAELIAIRISPSTMTAPPRTESHDDIDAQIAAFLARGGSIQCYDIGETGTSDGLPKGAVEQQRLAVERRKAKSYGRKAPAAMYVGKLCKTHGLVKRYESSGQCVECRRDRNLRKVESVQ